MARVIHEFMMRRIPPISRNIRADFEEFVKKLSSLSDSTWGVSLKAIPKFGKGGEFVHVINFSKCFREKVVSHLTYQLPDPEAEDKASSDDFFYLDFKPTDSTYLDFIQGFFQPLIIAFGPYRATLGPRNLALEDFDLARTKNWRYEIYRIFPVDFLTGRLVHSAFKLKIPKFIRRVQPFCDSVSPFHDGVLFVNRTMFSLDQCNDFSSKVIGALGQRT